MGFIKTVVDDFAIPDDVSLVAFHFYQRRVDVRAILVPDDGAETALCRGQ